MSVCWASCNLGASTPEGYGDYYAWDATEPWYKAGYAQSSSLQWKSGKSSGYTWANCPFNGGSRVYDESYWNAHKSECVDANNTLLPANDAAHVNLGGNWRMPTKEEFDELANTSNCSWTWTTLNGIKGYKVQSKKSGYTENWIFLPAAGYRYRPDLYDVGGSGYYWSSSLSSDFPNYAWSLDFGSGDVDTYDYGSRNLGRSVRPVTE